MGALFSTLGAELVFSELAPLPRLEPGNRLKSEKESAKPENCSFNRKIHATLLHGNRNRKKYFQTRKIVISTGKKTHHTPQQETNVS
jgi:hypothetical protein